MPTWRKAYAFTSRPDLESKDEQTALKALLKEDGIVIQKSDKGNSVVILNKDDYKKRMKELLDDTSKFKKIKIEGERDYNHLIKQELRILNALRRLRYNETITEYTGQHQTQTSWYSFSSSISIRSSSHMKAEKKTQKK